MIVMTSFFKAEELYPDLEKYSVAVYQPKGYKYPKIPWTDIRVDGKWTRPREFVDEKRPAEAYWNYLYGVYCDRIDEAKSWADSFEGGALCCWCPYDKAAKRQLKEFGSFICHTGVLADFMRYELDLEVHTDTDREKMYLGP